MDKILTNINIYVSNVCNLNCIYCYRRGKLLGKSTASFIKKFDNLCKAFCKHNISSITFTGGEPLLVANLLDFINIAKKYTLKVFLYTNGTIPLADALINRIDQITFSLDGNLNIMQMHRGISPKQYNTIMENINKCEKNMTEYAIATVITKKNINSFVNDILDFYKNLNLKLLKCLRINVVDTSDSQIKLDQIDKKKMLTSILELKKMLNRQIIFMTNIISVKEFIWRTNKKTMYFPVWLNSYDCKLYIQEHKKYEIERMFIKYKEECDKISQSYLKDINLQEEYMVIHI